jgi:hypothetical protein
MAWGMQDAWEKDHDPSESRIWGVYSLSLLVGAAKMKS